MSHVSVRRLLGPFLLSTKSQRRRAFTLIELLCVILIIAILMSLLVPALMRAYQRARDMSDEWEASEVAHLLKTETRRYCAVNLQFRFDSKNDLADKCHLTDKPRRWMMASATDFTPFDYLSPTNKLVVAVHIGRKHAVNYYFSKWDLTFPPE